MLGGGAGGLAAAFELTATEELRDRYDVTVYQCGWRLGGKGASGRRGDANQRIEEHGLHVWFGFYDDAFGLVRRAYEALGAEAPEVPWTGAFTPIERLVLWDRDDWDAPLVGLNGRPLAIYRAIESLELTAHLGLVAVALRGSGLFPPDQPLWAPLLAVVAGLVVLTLWEFRGYRPVLPETARWYTRLLLPAAAVIVFIAWWFAV